MRKFLTIFCCAFSMAVPLFSQSIYVEANGGGRLSLTQIALDEGGELKTSSKIGLMYGGKVGLVKFLKKGERAFALAGEFGFSIRQNTFDVDVVNTSITQPYQMQSYSVGIKPILRTYDNVYLTFPVAVLYNTFDLLNQIESDFTNPDLQLFYTAYSLETKKMGLSFGIGTEFCFNNDKKFARRRGEYKGLRIGASLNYTMLFNPIHELDITYKLNDSDYKRAIVNSSARGIEANLYVLVPIQITGGNSSYNSNKKRKLRKNRRR